ncbi:Fibronectin-binding protein A [[Clostridium] ultunense Esp]|uniref:Rqc2 homolog RqcH n=1 Tax=[Clostridium] ultunense Esp TaxID=1288971 RepID=M1ZKU2_9FIRM|nr:NFACT RNA binding domain-containing protein [Schnuerera ultunensis]CCQ96047.1 Fibronectin-binding protein A [[Clostridium] ultunense Esp]SHD76941.1 Fibronectin-binding protein A [[Clostridium] ultunense Esp]
MSLDGIVTRAIIRELNDTILGGRVDKIYQHERDEILINIYNRGKNRKLLISASSNNPRIHLTNCGKSNPSSPPMFCMLLRKHLTGGIILNIEQFHMDRIIFIDISSLDELGQPIEKRLIVEIMGKYSNIILIDKISFRVIDSIKRVTPDMSRIRQVLPGVEYKYPHQNNKINPLDLAEDQFFQLIGQDNGNRPIYRFFYTNYIGLGPLISKEICFQSNIDMDRPLASITFEEKKKIFSIFMAIVKRIRDNNFKPILIKNNHGRNYKAFYALDIEQFGNNKILLASISQVLDEYYIKNDTLDRVNQKAQSLRKSVQTKLERSLNKLAKQKQELLDSKNREKFKIYADLISANLYRIDKGLSQVELENFYSENMEKIIVPLDERYSPAENAQKYYKRYSKLKNANQLLLEQIPETEEEIDYLENVLNSIDHCTEVLELDEIKEELIKEGYLKGSIKKKQKKDMVSKPYQYISSDGFHIFVGKNNRQNDFLTLKTAHKEDLWLHVQKMPGSHVIVKTENRRVSEKTLEEAAILAAYYSKAKNSTNVAVDYTERKNVKKPKKAKAGMVIYENFSTIFVTPDKKIINKLAKIEGS